ncbi:MAG TPA: dihydrolipoyl dehydrogenase [Vicinamibacteria bacterium]|nr:dihydrolipoyl dehydrogenase [Vicinamibacteria bacterium]
MTEDTTYDVAILGSGPGGYVAAIRGGQLGLKVLLIEKDAQFGGTCLHVGCIPSKAFLYTAEILDTIRRARDHGVVVEGVQLDWSAMMKRKERVVRKLAAGVKVLLQKNGVETVHGFGKLASPRTLSVETPDETRTFEARNIIVATGSRPKSLPGVEIDGERILTNTELLSLPSCPERLAIIGAGAVGVEFASMFHSFGSKVTLIEMLPRLVPLEDEEVSEVLRRSFRKRGIEVLTGTRVDSVSRKEDVVEVRFTLEDGSSDSRTVDRLLMAVGRGPRTDGIGLDRAGIEVDRGFVRVDRFAQTSHEGIYAIGDVVATQQLAHVASAEGILAVEKIAGHPVHPLNYEHMPAATYCSPEVASVGLTEDQARSRGFAVKVGKFPFAASSKASILGENEGFVKVVSEESYGELLGVHIVGAHATDLIAEAVVALEHEATVESLMRSVHAHPTLSEAVAEAAHGAFDQPLHV